MSSIITHFLNHWKRTDTAQRQSIEYSPAPGTGIRFSPTLIDNLKDEHQQFFELVRDMKEAFRAGVSESIPPLMEKFDDLLTAHLLTERVRLYAYMDAYFATDRQTREMLRDYRGEMERIGDSARRLVKKYKALSAETDLQASFGRDIDELRMVLEERMRREEVTLYPLYMPVTQY